MASSNPPNNDDDNKSAKDDAAFRKDYSKALGEALRQAEDEQQQSTSGSGSGAASSVASSLASPQSQKLVHDTYRQLCHDDPIVSAAGCRLLARALRQQKTKQLSSSSSSSDNSNKYALSERLVEGLQQLLSSSAFTARSSTAKGPSATKAAASRESMTAAKSADADDEAKPPIADDEAQPRMFPGANDEDGDGDDANGASTTAAAAAAELAWTVYGRIPLECCLAGTAAATVSANGRSGSDGALEKAATMLGSYRGPSRAQLPLDDSSTLEASAAAAGEAAAAAEQENHPLMNGKSNGHDGNTPAEGENTPAEIEKESSEVWAVESDPSDFDFGDEINGPQHQRQLEQQLEAWAKAVEIQTDPLELSKVPTDTGNTTTWTHVAQAVTNLSAACSFSKLGALTVGQWKQLHIADDLTQWILLLLVAPTVGTSNSPLWQQEPATHWQKLGLQPLAVFRDAVVHFAQPTATFISSDRSVAPSVVALWESYLQLLQTLIQVHATQQLSGSGGGGGGGKNDKNTNEVVVAPATWVGCSSLSALCSHCISSKHGGGSGSDGSTGGRPTVRPPGIHSKLIAAVQQCVLQCSDDLTLLLETTTAKATTAAATTTTAEPLTASSSTSMTSAIQWTFLPFFQILTLSTSSVSTGSNNKSPLLSNTHAQTLLNSGLFRQWLTMWWEIIQTDADATIGRLVQQSIFSLCAGSPTLLGKYAWRFPGLAVGVTAATSTTTAATTATTTDGNNDNGSDHQLDLLLWNILGIHLAQQNISTTVSKVQWKNAKQNTAAAPTDQSCQQDAWSGFQALCQRLTETLSDWKTRRQENLQSGSNFSDQQQAAFSFVRLTDTLVATPLLTSIFTEHMVQPVLPEGDNLQSLRLNTIRAELGPIQQCLASWPAAPISHDAKAKADDDAEGDEDDMVELSNTTPRVRIKPGAEDESVDKVRRSVKVLVSLLDSSNGPSSSFSSKAD